MPTRISTIIPVHNGETTIRECLDALCGNNYPDHEIILVDDMSTDDSVAIAEEYPVTVVKLQKHSGPATARNWGAVTATGDILFFIDADVKVPKNALSLIAETFEDSSVEAITGLLSDTQRYRNFSSEYKNLWMNHTFDRLEGKVSVFYTSGAAILRDVFLDSGHFDENYCKPSIEDTDFGHRLRENGHDVYLNKGLAVEHMKKYSFPGMLRMDFIRSSSLTRLFLRRGLIWENHPNSSSVPASFISSVFLLFVCLFLLALSVVLRSSEILVPAVFLYAAFLTSNRAFMKTLWRKKGTLFVIMSVPAITVDTFVAGLGIITGCIGYLMGEKY
jgi:glycosyltransferase involved in cell wall biosynthesis